MQLINRQKKEMRANIRGRGLFERGSAKAHQVH